MSAQDNAGHVQVCTSAQDKAGRVQVCRCAGVHEHTGQGRVGTAHDSASRLDGGRIRISSSHFPSASVQGSDGKLAPQIEMCVQDLRGTRETFCG